ncbi:MAG TPA: 30S ribosomal protein S9 [Candidatus Woesebacteria bacterium]|jgi:small subunit ribosomal protein S9|nr:30S ribosomal protein S9 [Candidatus Woesebacteria bacterium]HNS65139.1 30S ribosomal protein S9 [Candidatus Woesebacteria bacterium]
MALKLNKKKTAPKKIVKKIQRLKTAKSKVGTVELLTPPTGQYFEGIGRRKSAIARVRIYPKVKGDYVVNGKVVGQYFSSLVKPSTRYLLPLEVTGTTGTFAVFARVSGSGISGQLDAVVHGLSRALEKHNPDFHGLLKQAGLLTRDSRQKETRKIGMGGKARRRRQSPKR